MNIMISDSSRSNTRLPQSIVQLIRGVIQRRNYIFNGMRTVTVQFDQVVACVEALILRRLLKSGINAVF